MICQEFIETMTFMPPWKDSPEWRDIDQTLMHMISMEAGDLELSRSKAAEIHARLESIVDLFSRPFDPTIYLDITVL